MIKTLKEAYCDYSVNRSQIVHKLLNMMPASDFANSCLSSFQEIQVLLNRIGYDVRNTCDPCGQKLFWQFPRVRCTFDNGRMKRSLVGLQLPSNPDFAAMFLVQNKAILSSLLW